MKLLIELFATGQAMLQSYGSIHFDPLFDFLVKCVHNFGAVVENVTLSIIRGSVVTDTDKEVKNMLEDLMLKTISAARESIGFVGTKSIEQKQGQPAFESKPSLPRKPGFFLNEALTGVFTLMRICMDMCPLFLLHLSTGQGSDRKDDILLISAINCAVMSLNDSDPEMARTAMKFLTVVVRSPPVRLLVDAY
jgi:hypothetical protein